MCSVCGGPRAAEASPVRCVGERISGSRYFCESLFWASQPKQAAKT
ncbi:hypothetical protein [Bathymodiolus japonicus methanotrophic gill symbiont]|nr:hypothetical protein [Bathymodiolus japonicus methanotrophic gill symbiont]